MPGSSTVDDFQRKVQRYCEQQFTGVVQVIAHPGQWFICLLLGRIVWIRSRSHPLRRWKRSLALYSPTLARQISQRKGVPDAAWNYQALAHLVKLNKLPENQLSNIIESVVTEDLFDIFQVGEQQYRHSGQTLMYEAVTREVTSLPAVMINHHRALREAKDQWNDWNQAGLAEYSPDFGLRIRDFENLRLRAAPQTLQTLKACCNHQNTRAQKTLRDLAISFRQPVILLAKSMLPYVSEKLLMFSEVPDLAENVSHGFAPALFTDDLFADTLSADTLSADNRFQGGLQNESQQVKASLSTGNSGPSVANDSQHLQQNSLHRQIRVKKKAKPNAPKIVYIDDSPVDSHTMATMVEKLGCQYTNIPDPIQALPLLLEIKPDLIFLDLVMPIANGYEVCEQIRRISAFKTTPVIIVTSNDGVADRVKARIVGASGFLGKPIQEQKVDQVLRKHLQDLIPARVLQSKAPAAFESASVSSTVARPTASDQPQTRQHNSRKSSNKQPNKPLGQRVREALFSR